MSDDKVGLSDEAGISKRLSEIKKRVKWNDVDRCLVVPTKCERCGEMYEEELIAARARVVSSLPSFCLGCDGFVGEQRTITRVLIPVWYTVY